MCNLTMLNYNSIETTKTRGMIDLRLKTEDYRLKTQDSRLKTQDTELKTRIRDIFFPVSILFSFMPLCLSDLVTNSFFTNQKSSARLF